MARPRLRRVDAVQHAHALELPVDAVDVGAELRRVAQHDRPRPRQVDADLVDHLAGARAHHEDAVGQPDRLLDAVGDEQHRGPAAQPQRLEVRAHLQAREGVERAERLVHQDHRRVVHQRADQRHALAHAAGELARVLAHRVRRGAAARTAPSRAPRPCARGMPRMSACSITLSNAVRKSSSRWSWKAMPTSVIGFVHRRPADHDVAATCA